MSALAHWCYRHRFVVITAWIGLLIGLAVMSQAVKTSYDNSLTLPGTGSGSAQELLLRSAPARAGDSDQIVWQVRGGLAGLGTPGLAIAGLRREPLYCERPGVVLGAASWSASSRCLRRKASSTSTAVWWLVRNGA